MDLLWKTNPVQVWGVSQGNDREEELDSGQNLKKTPNHEEGKL